MGQNAEGKMAKKRGEGREKERRPRCTLKGTVA